MNELDQNILSLRLGTEVFKYAVFDPFQEQLPETIVWNVNPAISMTANLKMFFHQNEELKEYKRVNVKVESGRYVCVPVEFFDENVADTYFYHNLPRQENEKILWQSIESVGIVVLYALDTNAYQLLSEIYPNVKFIIHVVPVIELFAAKSHQGNNKKLYVNLRNEALDVICLEHGKLLLANSYYCRETGDRAYYLLYVWKQLGFDQERDDISMLGTVPERDLLIQQLDKYIRHRFLLPKSVEDDLKNIWKCV